MLILDAGCNKQFIDGECRRPLRVSYADAVCVSLFGYMKRIALRCCLSSVYPLQL
jgi:hypothetical protein